MMAFGNTYMFWSEVVGVDFFFGSVASCVL